MPATSGCTEDCQGGGAGRLCSEAVWHFGAKSGCENPCEKARENLRENASEKWRENAREQNVPGFFRRTDAFFSGPIIVKIRFFESENLGSN